MNPVADLVHEIENLSKAEAIERPGALRDNIDKFYFALGGVLSVVQKNGWFEPYPTFGEFVEQSVGMRYRKAAYLVEIYDAMADAKVAWAKFQHLDWTKMRLLARVVTAGSSDNWITIATESTKLEHEKVVREYLEKAEIKQVSHPKPSHSKTFKFHDDQMEIVAAAIARAKEEAKTATVQRRSNSSARITLVANLFSRPHLRKLDRQASLLTFGKCFPREGGRPDESAEPCKEK